MSHLLLIHGAFGGAWEFQGLIEGLRQQGQEASAIDLPGHGQNLAPTSEVTMDAYVRRVIEAVEAIDGPVVLVGHSLGGAVISQVAEKIPQKIESLVFVAATLPRKGETPLALMESDADGQLLSRLTFSEDQSYATVSAETVKEVLLHDVSESERLERYLPYFVMKQSLEPFLFEAEVTEAAFGSVPKFYVRASLDKVMSPSLQDRMLSGWAVEEVFYFDSGHYPLLSMPGRLIEVLGKVVGVAALRP